MDTNGLLGIVDIEEVRIQKCLDYTCHNWIGFKAAALCKITIQPIRDIEGTIHAQSKEIMGSYGICFSSSLQHEKLRQNGDRFKPDRKGPEYLKRCQYALYHTSSEH